MLPDSSVNLSDLLGCVLLTSPQQIHADTRKSLCYLGRLLRQGSFVGVEGVGPGQKQVVRVKACTGLLNISARRNSPDPALPFCSELPSQSHPAP